MTAVEQLTEAIKAEKLRCRLCPRTTAVAVRSILLGWPYGYSPTVERLRAGAMHCAGDACADCGEDYGIIFTILFEVLIGVIVALIVRWIVDKEPESELVHAALVEYGRHGKG